MKLTDQQTKFQNRVIGWMAMREMFGDWEKVAKHFKVKKTVLIRAIFDDLEKTWGKKLKWEDTFK